MGYIYELMDLAKGKIAFTCGGIEKNYGLIWIKLDVRWTPQLHGPLYALGYCLNLKCATKINSLMRCGTDYLNAYIGCWVLINI